MVFQRAEKRRDVCFRRERQRFCTGQLYAGEKKIAITVAMDGKRVKISVTDNGIGINAHDLPHIFERFWRADQARNAKGLGLGLCLAKMIVELHGGRIDVKSAVGAGSTFEVFLPW